MNGPPGDAMRARRWVDNETPTRRDPAMSEPNTEAEPGPKREVSPARLDANRANSLKSTGPRTPEGKEASRLNGLVHGLRPDLPIIPAQAPESLRPRLPFWPHAP